MSVPSSGVRNVADTARWVAYFRARETERSDALFQDPYAKRLAGDLGFQIANTLPGGNKQEWAWVARTYLFDEFLRRVIREGADVVLNLAAGLDARPYRMDLPASLRWVEVDFPEIISYKADVLAGERPRCQLKRICLDLSDASARGSLFKEVSQGSTKVAVVSEGLLIYFASDEVGSLARDLSANPRFRHWVIDLASPGQLKLMQRSTGKELGEAGAAFKFAPSEGPKFFIPHGWSAEDVRGLLKTAAQFSRAPVELLSLATDWPGASGDFPWTGVCLLSNCAIAPGPAAAHK